MRFLPLFLFSALLITCSGTVEHHKTFVTNHSSISCNDVACYGEYKGSEFKNGLDVAHQFSNHIADSVGAQLKQLYAKKRYSQVDFQNIEMITLGMGTGYVEYVIKIPFRFVNDSCLASTSFDHCGGWNHSPNLDKRKEELKSALLPGDRLFVSQLKTTPEGLQEYWIQWRNKRIQAHCQ